MKVGEIMSSKKTCKDRNAGDRDLNLNADHRSRAGYKEEENKRTSQKTHKMQSISPLSKQSQIQGQKPKSRNWQKSGNPLDIKSRV